MVEQRSPKPCVACSSRVSPAKPVQSSLCPAFFEQRERCGAPPRNPARGLAPLTPYHRWDHKGCKARALKGRTMRGSAPQPRKGTCPLDPPYHEWITKGVGLEASALEGRTMRGLGWSPVKACIHPLRQSFRTWFIAAARYSMEASAASSVFSQWPTSTKTLRVETCWL